MEERQVLHTVSRGHPYRVFGRAVSPIGLSGELLGRVLRVMDEKVDSIDKLARGIADAIRTILGLLVIGKVRNRPPVEIEPITESRTNVRNEPCTHVHSVDEEVTFVGVDEIDCSRNAIESDGKQRRAHQFVEHCLHAHAVVLARAMDGEHRVGIQQRGKERKTLRVIEVRMREKTRSDESRVARETFAPEIPEARAEVEENRLASG